MRRYFSVPRTRGLVILVFETLALLSGDEPQTMYGLLAEEMRVAQIVTFGTMKARAAVKDVARVLKIAPGDADAMVAAYRAAMDKGMHTNTTILSNYKPAYSVDWSPYGIRDWKEPYDTTVPLKTRKNRHKDRTP